MENGLKFITLGHNYKDVAAHPFYGSDKVIKELKEKFSHSWPNVDLTNTAVIRNSNNIVIGYLPIV